MASAPPSGVLDDFDLHALVDGRIEGERHATLLRRLATSPIDQARVAAWQGQNDLLRNAFAGIEREPLPAILDLKATSRLRCIPANDAPLIAPTPRAGKSSAWRGAHLAALVATILVIGAGLGGAWLLFDSFRSEGPTPTRVDATARETVAVANAAAGPGGLDRLPTTDIPDLDAAGFKFIGAETVSAPPMIIFRYKSGEDRVAVSVARTPTQNDDTSSPARTSTGYRWHTHHKSFVIAGTLKPERLLVIARSIQDESSAK